MSLRPPPPEFFAWYPVIRWFLERLNAAVGGLLLQPTSWWRSPEENDRVRGQDESQHLYGLAVDFVGTDHALQALLTGSGLLGLPAILEEGLGALIGRERPLSERIFSPARPHVHVQAFEKGTLARLGVPFPP